MEKKKKKMSHRTTKFKLKILGSSSSPLPGNSGPKLDPPLSKKRRRSKEVTPAACPLIHYDVEEASQAIPNLGFNSVAQEMHGTDQATTQATQNAPRKRKKTSKAWEDFVSVGLGNDGKERGQCIHCGYKTVISDGTKSMLRHLRKCTNKPKEEDTTCLNPPTKKATKKQAGTSMDGTSASQSVTQSDLAVMKEWIKEQNAILLQNIVKENAILHQTIVKDMRKLLGKKKKSGKRTSFLRSKRSVAVAPVMAKSSIPSDLDGAEETNQTPQDEGVPPSPITWPNGGALTNEWVHGLMSSLEWASWNLAPSELPSLMPVNVFDSLILTASKILHEERNCVRIDDIDSESKVVVVGDIHGQLHDLLFLLKDSGFPCQNRYYVFNGDYVDRGAWGLETFLVLLSWKVLMPDRVYLLRGNHESKYCTSMYGFEKEVLEKYGDKGKHVYRQCLGCFEWLPLASIISGRVYTAHGGLFRSPVLPKKTKGKKKRRVVLLEPESSSLILGTLDELKRARRSVLNPPFEGPNLIPGDVLWSDPSMTPGLSPNEERGIGLLWGPDCTDDFLKKNELKLIIRSHEGPDAREKRDDLGGMDEGYTIDHTVESGKLITVFSAPDYPQFQATEERYKNKGAYITLQAPDFSDPQFHSFEAVKRPEAPPYYDFENVIDSDDEMDKSAMDTNDEQPNR